MSADDLLERRLEGALHGWLDAAVGPDPHWHGSPAEVASHTMARPGSRRRVTSWALVAAVVVVLLVAALVGVLVAGGRLESVRPSPPGQPAVVVTQPSPSPAGTPSSTAAPASAPAAQSSPPPCQRRWDWAGTASPVGLTDGVRIDELDGAEGFVLMVFGHPLDTVRGISILPAEPPFGTSPTKVVKVEGVEHYRLTITGLNRPTQNLPDDIVADASPRPRARSVGSPIVEMRRIAKPKVSFPVNGPGPNSTETWIIGVDRPTCVQATTLHDVGYGGGYEPGDNAVVIHFVAAP